MAERQAFDDYLADRNLRAARVVALFGALIVPSGVVLDWFTHRDRIGWLFLLRLSAAAVAAVCLWLSRWEGARRHTFLLGFVPVLATAVAIEVMVEGLGGYSSPYYAGITQCLFALGVIFYWRVREIMVACAVVIAVWLVPTLVHASRIESGPFANNIFALGVAAAIAVASNSSRLNAVKREHSARSELQDALDRLKELDHAKNQFFANVSHELRTPLTLILAPLSELRERGLAHPDDRELVEVAQRNAERLLRHIDELLDLSRLDAGRLRLNLGEVDLSALVGAQVENSRATARSLGLELSLDAPRGVPDVWGDAYRLDIVLTNLVGNALKYTPSGGRIVVRLVEADAHAIVEVTDTGDEISEGDLQHVFERFYQVGRTDRRRQRGAGIGLALARELVELHGGTLTAKSEVGSGSTFALRLKKGRSHFSPEVIDRRTRVRTETDRDRRYDDVISPGAQSEPVPRSAPDAIAVAFADGRRPRILLVEDHVDLRLLIHRLLEAHYEVTDAVDGSAALEQARRSLPDLVISDVMMPRMSGTELCRALKADPLLKAIPVILLTARVGSEATMDAYAHGADDFVSKPFHPRVLMARIAAQLKLRALTIQLISQEKAAGIGILAAGVAHEVRNPLNAITGACAILHEGTASPERQLRLLSVALDAAGRVEAIVSALDSHARPADADGVKPCDVREGIEATLRLLEYRMDHVSVHRSYKTDRRALVRPAAINQVVLNLVDNAIKANSTNIWIGITEANDRLVVDVADDGGGVSAAVAPKIFDPFFTTREPGLGKGLGLHLSRQILIEHGGRLWHEARDGGGAKFAFDVPIET